MNRVEQVVGGPAYGNSDLRRAVYFYDGPRWPVGPGQGNGYLFRPPYRWDALHFGDRYRMDIEDTFPVPRELLAAFEAGAPIEPILDWLLEHYADTHPWLADAVARVCNLEGATT
jgi:hypothetical protein